MELGTHEMRHFATSMWVRAGATELFVMRVDGWSDLAMVAEPYGHLWPSDATRLGAQMNKLDLSEMV